MPQSDASSYIVVMPVMFQAQQVFFDHPLIFFFISFLFPNFCLLLHLSCGTKQAKCLFLIATMTKKAFLAFILNFEIANFNTEG